MSTSCPTSSSSSSSSSSSFTFSASWAAAAASSLTFGALALTAGAEASIPTTPPTPTETNATKKVWKTLPKEITLYQYEVCPFCCKAKAALDFYRVPYQVVEVNPLTKKQIKPLQERGLLPGKDQPVREGGKKEKVKVPILVADGEVITESNEIIDRLDALAKATGRKGGKEGGKGQGKGKGLWGAGRAQGKDEAEIQRWRKRVDEIWVRVITVNIYRSWSESVQTFDYIGRECHWGTWETNVATYAGATIMRLVAWNMVRKYSIEGDVRDRLFELSNEWTDAVGEADFLGGDEPSTADLAVFGVLQAVRGTDAFTELMEVTRIRPWYMRMINVMPKSLGKRIHT